MKIIEAEFAGIPLEKETLIKFKDSVTGAIEFAGTYEEVLKMLNFAKRQQELFDESLQD